MPTMTPAPRWSRRYSGAPPADKRNVVLLTLGTGVGGAVLVDGTILRGASGAAGHLGHMTLDIHGGLCICGNRGCVETRFSSRAIESDYLAHLHRAAPAKLSVGRPDSRPPRKRFFALQPRATKAPICVLERAFEYLAGAIVSVLHIFDPEVSIIGGNIAEAGPQLLSPIRGRSGAAHAHPVGAARFQSYFRAWSATVVSRAPPGWSSCSRDC